jgi:hypothetical protein
LLTCGEGGCVVGGGRKYSGGECTSEGFNGGLGVGLELRHYLVALKRVAVSKMVDELVITVLEDSMILVQLFVPLVLTHVLLLLLHFQFFLQILIQSFKLIRDVLE